MNEGRFEGILLYSILTALREHSTKRSGNPQDTVQAHRVRAHLK